MSDCPQFIPTVRLFSPPTPPSPPSGDDPPDFPLPGDTQDYIVDIRNDLHSGDPELQADGLRRLLIEALERGVLDFQATGEVARMEFELGFAGAVAELALCAICPDLWPPEMEASEVVPGTEVGRLLQ